MDLLFKFIRDLGITIVIGCLFFASLKFIANLLNKIS